MSKKFDPYNCGELSAFKQRNANKLTKEEMRRLANWCDCQCEELWEGMSQQDILNVYHVSVEWMTFEDWFNEEQENALAAWNSAVQDKNNHLR